MLLAVTRATRAPESYIADRVGTWCTTYRCRVTPNAAVTKSRWLTLTQVRSVRLRVMAEGVERVVTLTDIFLAPKLSCNIMSFGKLEQKGFKIPYSSGARSLVRRSDG